MPCWRLRREDFRWWLYRPARALRICFATAKALGWPRRFLLLRLLAALSRHYRLCGPGERFSHGWIEPFRTENALKVYEKLIDATLMEGRP